MTPEQFKLARETLCPADTVTSSRVLFADKICLSKSQVIRIETGQGNQTIQPHTEKIIELLLAIHNTDIGKQFGV